MTLLTPTITPSAAERQIPSRKDAVIFRAKTLLLQIRRTFSNVFIGRLHRFSVAGEFLSDDVIGSSVTPLWTEADPREQFLLAGKVHNLRLAIRRLNGIEVPAGEIFSFWRQVGRTSRLKGYVAGRELREGCVIPSIGGGLCQISNALYDAALQANFEIIERHAHTRVIPGSLAEDGRDATVFWNYVDLRFRSNEGFRVEAAIDASDLKVTFRGRRSKLPVMHQIRRRSDPSPSPNSCATCETGDCHRVVEPSPKAERFGRAAFIVDEFGPEFDEFIAAERTEADILIAPMDGVRFKKANYAWSKAGFGNYRQNLLTTLRRSYSSRKLAVQGSKRQMNLLKMYAEMAESSAAKIKYDTLHLVVQQELLPHLMQSGELGGRTFDVLMTALPMNEIQKRLDRAAGLHPNSRTLADFRADPEVVAAESRALEQANRIITPHSDIAALFPEKAVLLPWKIPAAKPHRPNEKPLIVFPASTLGRKGCYELRQAMSGLDAELIILGGEIEAPDFWSGLSAAKGTPEDICRAWAVVLPAFVEHKPRRLLMAAAAGVPVIASKACGLSQVDGVVEIEAGDVAALRTAIEAVLEHQKIF